MTDEEMNYFTVIEEHFQVTRGSGSFRLSPLDFALIETWKESGVPLLAILRGIDRTFENWHKQQARARTQRVNSVGYCTQEIAIEAQAHASAVPSSRPSTEVPFSFDTVQQFIARNADTLRENGYVDLAAALEQLDLEVLYPDFEQLDRRLTTIEETMIARLFAAATADVLAAARGALERDLKPYRERMTAEQLAMLEKQFLEKRLLESAGLPRLSLFYL